MLLPRTPESRCRRSAIGDGIEVLNFKRRLRCLATAKAATVVTEVGHSMRDDQMTLRVDRDLDVVADEPEPRPLVAIERESGSVSDICWSGVASIFTLRISRRCNSSFSFRSSLQAATSWS